MDDLPNIDQTLADTYREMHARGAFSQELPESFAPQGAGAAQDAAAEAGSDGQNDDGHEDTGAIDDGAASQAAGGEAHDDGGTEEDAAAGAAAAAQQQFRPKWKKEALAEYDKLPANVRAEIERREGDFHKGIEQYKASAATAQEWDRTLQPYMATINGFGVTPQVAINELLKTDHFMRYAPMQQKIPAALQVLSGYGIDLPTLVAGIQQMAGQQAFQQQNPMDPRTQELQARVQRMEQEQYQSRQQAQQAEHSAIDAEIVQFASDPDHEHFGVLQQDMAMLLQAGRAKNLDDAYEMAMRANPQTAPIWLAQQQQKQESERRQKVEAARKSQRNVVRPNGRTSGAQAAAIPATLEETIEAQARSMGLVN